MIRKKRETERRVKRISNRTKKEAIIEINEQETIKESGIIPSRE